MHQCKFLVQLLDKPTRGEVLLGLVPNCADELIKEVKTGSNLGCRDHALVELVTSRYTGLAKSKNRTPKLLKSEIPVI